MRADQQRREPVPESPLRPLADRRPAHRRGAHGTLQLALRPRHGRDAGAADRGHRPRALDPGERRADPRRAALARARLGRGAAEPGRARASATASGSPSWSRPGTAYPDTATAEDVRAYKQAHGNAGYRGEPRAGEGAAIRLRVPDEGETVVDDLIRGPVRFENRLTDDLVIARGDGTPLYNFAVAVDDAEMGITDVIRGDDHLSNTPEAAARARGARAPSRRATRTCRCSTGPTARSSPSATAPPRCRSCATPATCRPRSATTSRCSAGAPTTTRRSSRPPSWSSSSRSSGSGAPRRSSTSASCAGSTAATCASCRSTRYVEAAAAELERAGHARGRRRPRAARAPPARSPRRRRRRSTEVWPLIAFLFEPPVDDPKAWSKVMERDGVAAALDGGARGPARGRAVRRADARGGARRAGRAPAASSRATLYQPLRVAITGTTVSPGIFESLAALGRERGDRARRGGAATPARQRSAAA